VVDNPAFLWFIAVKSARQWIEPSTAFMDRAKKPWFPRKSLALFILAISLTLFRGLAQTAPQLGISLLTPSIVEISWPTNFADWQLFSTDRLGPLPNWQPVQTQPFPLDAFLVVFFQMSGTQTFFRLQKGGSCIFQATPSVITAGGSSLLSWCPSPGVSYFLFPGPGPVTGGMYTVSPAVTTLYTLIASNAVGSVSNFATVTVINGSCSFANVSSWDGSLSFSYEWTPSNDSYTFAIRQEAHLTFHLARSAVFPTLTEYTGYLSGNGQINDELDDHTIPPPNTTTMVGSGAPERDPIARRTRTPLRLVRRSLPPRPVLQAVLPPCFPSERYQ
jgi:hypothetical protein